jgi:hypothetical protein
LREEKISSKHSKEIIQIIEQKLNFKSNIKFIDIYPGHENYKLFFTSFFSLDKSQLQIMLNAGYEKTHQVFKKEKF